MAKANLVEKKVRLKLDEIVKFQIATYCHLEKLTVSEADLDCLVMLGLLGESDLSEFCTLIASKKIFRSTQTVRNCLVRMENYNLVIKEGLSKKKHIKLNPNLKVQTTGNIVLIYKIAYIETPQV